MNELSWERRAALKRLLASGSSHRAIAATLRVAKGTVTRYAGLWKVDARCACGQPAGHRGWCRVRFEFSPKRQRWLAKHWEKRAETDLALVVDAARISAERLKHRLGPFVWGSAMTSTLAYALCAICGKAVRIHSQGEPERFDGTAIRDVCLTRAERAALKAALQEKREWRNAKKELDSVKKALRDPSRLRELASQRAATSPPSSQP